ncbi:MAG TPA: transcription antitermination protein NusB [Acholeplasma sp.]|jgi:N utilization substance protein B|nr:transcription antitermination protein NusB [Acholeplasma sp.]
MSRRKYREKIIFNLYELDLMGNSNFDKETEAGKTTLDIISKMEKIDEVIESNLYNYKLYRLAYLDKAIIRLATYEMIYTKEPKQVIINEAIELTKEYSDIDDKQKAFTNKVLDNIKNNLGDISE